jgi:hypothetical protein
LAEEASEEADGLPASGAAPSTDAGTGHASSGAGAGAGVKRKAAAGGPIEEPPPMLAKTGSAGTAAAATDESGELPPGWHCEVVGGRARFIGPDGRTQMGSLAKAWAWHQKQVQIAAQFESAHSSKRRRSTPPPGPTLPAAPSNAPPNPPPNLPPDAPAFSSTPPLSMMASDDALGGGAGSSAPHPLATEVEASISPGKGADGGRKPRRLPRELRNLALPDREWNVAMPFYTTEAKTREQFTSNADTLAAAAAARAHHEERAAEEARSSDARP